MSTATITVPNLAGQKVRDAYNSLQAQGILLKVERPNGTVDGAKPSDYDRSIIKNHDECAPGSQSQCGIVLVCID